MGLKNAVDNEAQVIADELYPIVMKYLSANLPEEVISNPFSLIESDAGGIAWRWARELQVKNERLQPGFSEPSSVDYDDPSNRES